jgi:hypothetical protein
MLLGSEGRSWDYQVFPQLIKELRSSMFEHYTTYINGFIDKQSIPLYLFLSGAGTGKSRNAAELHKTAYNCFNGTHFPKHKDAELAKREEKLAQMLETPFVFHISLENGTGLGFYDLDPWTAIGSRMLLQLLGEPDNKDWNLQNRIDKIIKKWHPPNPVEVINSVISKDESKTRAVFIIVDGLHNVEIFGEGVLAKILGQLGNLTHWDGFIVVCSTSIISGPVETILKGSHQIRILLPCGPLKVPTINQMPVIEVENNIIAEMLVKDCDGHGRALEMVSSLFQQGLLSKDPGPEVSDIVQQLSKKYAGVIPEVAIALAMVKAVMVNRLLIKNEPIPGTETTPDAVCQNGLIWFESCEQGSAEGYLRIPYIWVLVLYANYRHTSFFRELQFLDYHMYYVKANPREPGHFSWADFESIMVKVRKIKSYAFDNNIKVTAGDLHRGSAMHPETAKISFTNHHLIDVVSKYKIETTRTESYNEKEWMITTDFAETVPTQTIDLREHKHIVLNGNNASAADAFLSLDSTPACNEVHQYKNVKDGNKVKFNEERKKAAGDNDIFCLFCTSNIPSLLPQNVPYGSVVVTEKYWKNYFGPYAARTLIYARKTKPEEKEVSSQAKRRKCDQ